MNSCDLARQHCQPCEGGIHPIPAELARARLPALPDWRLVDRFLEKAFTFRNHYETMTFVNAIAWISHCENHHPELTVGYNYCRVRYWTHAIDGLSENDFICAAKVERLLEKPETQP